MSCKKRLYKDLQLFISEDNNKSEIYFNTEDKIYTNHLHDIYHLLWTLNQKNVPTDIIRVHVLSYLQLPIRMDILKKMNYRKIPFIFTIKTRIFDENEWDFRFKVSSDFPFKPPHISINNVPLYRVKDLGKDDKETLSLMIDIDKYFYSNWSPALTIKSCMDVLKMAIDIHKNLPYKSNFVKLVEESPTNILKVAGS